MASSLHRVVKNFAGLQPVISGFSMAPCSRMAARSFSSLRYTASPSARTQVGCSQALQIVRSASTKRTSTGGMFPMWSIPVFLLFGGSAIFFIRSKKEEIRKDDDKQQRMSVGKALIGGPFELLDMQGKTVTEKNFEGDFILVYFGFTNCPDVCPDQLDKLSEAIKSMDKITKFPPIQPVFISVDPDRDTPEAMKAYLSEFHPRFMGLTGSKEQIDKVCKEYRVYYSMSPKDDDNDYIVDHTIICYLVGPDGEFMDYFGQNRTADEIAAGMSSNFTKYMLEHGDLGEKLREERRKRQQVAK
ncbi:protein SCO1 homolog, mitochondrial-like [Sycon ciliatum]|uniref:protein SCO1 homolog, mitochondrial-like n=1 Tax=Sycon ciliatum TaxID=27933 RepID=UPI0031F6B77C